VVLTLHLFLLSCVVSRGSRVMRVRKVKERGGEYESIREMKRGIGEKDRQSMRSFSSLSCAEQMLGIEDRTGHDSDCMECCLIAQPSCHTPLLPLLLPRPQQLADSEPKRVPSVVSCWTREEVRREQGDVE
jgi:hypothetical protein